MFAMKPLTPTLVSTLAQIPKLDFDVDLLRRSPPLYAASLFMQDLRAIHR